MTQPSSSANSSTTSSPYGTPKPSHRPKPYLPTSTSSPSTPSKPITIRPASPSPSDISGIIAVLEPVWISSFGHSAPQEDIDAYVRTTFSTESIKRELENPDNLFFVAIEDERVVGVIQLKSGTEEHCLEKEARPMIEVNRMYVEIAGHGKGIAKKLMEHALEEAKKRECKTVWLGVWEHNPQAQKFYKKFGFEHVGEHDFMVGNDKQTDEILVKRL